MQSHYFLNQKYQASIRLLWLCSPVCVAPGRKLRRQVFSRRGPYESACQHVSAVLHLRRRFNVEMVRGLQLSDNPTDAGVISFGNIQSLSGRRHNREMWSLRLRKIRSLLSLSVAVEYTCKVACRENDFMVFYSIESKLCCP